MAGRSKHPTEWAQKFIEARAFIVFLCLSIFSSPIFARLKVTPRRLLVENRFRGDFADGFRLRPSDVSLFFDELTNAFEFENMLMAYQTFK